VTEAAPPVAEFLNLGGRVALMTGRPVPSAPGVVVHYRCDADGAAAVVDAMGAAGLRHKCS
jgi:hypothetical protein